MLGLPWIGRAAWVLVLEVVLAVPLLVLSLAPRRRAKGWLPRHCRGMTVAFAAKTALFVWAMLPVVVRQGPGLVTSQDPATTAMLALHVVVGALSILLGWRVILALRLKLPFGRAYTPHALKNAMRWTAVTWGAGLVLGVLLYWRWYG